MGSLLDGVVAQFLVIQFHGWNDGLLFDELNHGVLCVFSFLAAEPHKFDFAGGGEEFDYFGF